MIEGMSPISIRTLKETAVEKPLVAAIHAQLQSRVTRATKAGKPYLELGFADATGHFALKVWSDAAIYQQAEAVDVATVWRLEAEWSIGTYGVEAKNLAIYQPDEAALTDFFAGDPVIRAKQDRGYEEICLLCQSIVDPRLHALCERYFTQLGERFRRTAAAKRNHHARRGGLVEHVVQMMKAADALCAVYPELNRDLMLAGVLFHDCGKLWENCYPEHGFAQIHSVPGELLGHIPLGIELVNKLWREMIEEVGVAEWAGIKPATEDVRLHLLHLIGSHHGEYEFGSPVLPRTPEAFALHYVDNLDAKLEMVRDAYAQSNEIAPSIFERVFPLSNNLVRPLLAYSAGSNEIVAAPVADGDGGELADRQ